MAVICFFGGLLRLLRFKEEKEEEQQGVQVDEKGGVDIDVAFDVPVEQRQGLFALRDGADTAKEGAVAGGKRQKKRKLQLVEVSDFLAAASGLIHHSLFPAVRHVHAAQ